MAETVFVSQRNMNASTMWPKSHNRYNTGKHPLMWPKSHLFFNARRTVQPRCHDKILLTKRGLHLSEVAKKTALFSVIWQRCDNLKTKT